MCTAARQAGMTFNVPLRIMSWHGCTSQWNVGLVKDHLAALVP